MDRYLVISADGHAGPTEAIYRDYLDPAFRERFEAKGRLREYLARIPTAVITHPFPAFVGLGRWLAAHK